MQRCGDFLGCKLNWLWHNRVVAVRKKIPLAEMRKLTSSMRGKYKPKPSEKSGLEILMEERAKDKIREEEKIQRWLGGRQQRFV
jgi:hypothetical protein